MQQDNYAFIDGNNLYLGAKQQRIALDYRKLRLFLKNKYQVQKALVFIGYDESHEHLYHLLRQSGYICVFKRVVKFRAGCKKMMKGNVDAELVLHAAAIDYQNYDKAVIISGDGDFACLIEYLHQHGKLKRVIAPTPRFSSLLKKYNNYITVLTEICQQVSK